EGIEHQSGAGPGSGRPNDPFNALRLQPFPGGILPGGAGDVSLDVANQCIPKWFAEGWRPRVNSGVPRVPRCVQLEDERWKVRSKNFSTPWETRSARAAGSSTN